MRKIVFVNGKGGVGKSTCSVLVALSFARAQIRVALDDHDIRQQSTAEWARRLGTEEEHVVALDATPPPEFTIIDTPGNMEFVEKPDFPIANLYIVPTSTSMLDQKVTRDTVLLLKQRFPNTPVRILFNKVAPNTRDAQDFGAYGDAIGTDPLKNVLRQRACYRYTALEGWEVLTKDAEDELLRLTMEIATIATTA